MDMTLPLDNGKYVIKLKNNKITAYKNGEHWRDLTGDNLGDNLILHMLMHIADLECSLLPEVQTIEWTGKNLFDVITFTDKRPELNHMVAMQGWEIYKDLVEKEGLKIYTNIGQEKVEVGDYIAKNATGSLSHFSFKHAQPIATMRIVKRNLEQFLENKTVEKLDLGLCLSIGLNKLKNVEKMYETWKNYSGNKAYPVPNTLTKKELENIERISPWRNYITEEELAYNHLNLYEGKQLELRLSLAKHILKCINRMLEK